ncbi:MAG: hypothetical protein JWM90_2032 [Thermoleophilia bacterium]|nr:hypothetical protein [Thermoleophilia bacterium]
MLVPVLLAFVVTMLPIGCGGTDHASDASTPRGKRTAPKVEKQQVSAQDAARDRLIRAAFSEVPEGFEFQSDALAAQLDDMRRELPPELVAMFLRKEGCCRATDPSASLGYPPSVLIYKYAAAGASLADAAQMRAAESAKVFGFVKSSLTSTAVSMGPRRWIRTDFDIDNADYSNGDVPLLHGTSFVSVADGQLCEISWAYAREDRIKVEADLLALQRGLDCDALPTARSVSATL